MAAMPAPPSTRPSNTTQAQPQQDGTVQPTSSSTTTSGSTANSSATPANATPGQFNYNECFKYLSSRHTAAMEALASNHILPHEKPELYKPPGANNSLSGGWGSGKHTSMVNGTDFMTALLNKLDQKNSNQHLNHPHPPHSMNHPKPQ